MRLWWSAAIAAVGMGVWGWHASTPRPPRIAMRKAIGTHPGEVGIHGQLTPIAPRPGDELAAFSAGCFWGSEEAFRKMPGIVATAVGYSGGTSAFPTEAVAHQTGHAETVLVEFDPRRTPYSSLLKTFWKLRTAAEPESLATQKSPYGPKIWTYSDRQQAQAEANKHAIEQSTHHKLRVRIQPAKPFYMAEGFHQQYDEKLGTEACSVTP